MQASSFQTQYIIRFKSYNLYVSVKSSVVCDKIHNFIS